MNTDKVTKLTSKQEREAQKKWAALHNDAVDFLNELRGLMHGSSILKREMKSPMPMVAVMALTMMSVEVMINFMTSKDGKSEMTSDEVNKLLHTMINSVVPQMKGYKGKDRHDD